MNPNYLALLHKCINGDQDAIALVEIALDVALDTAYLRGADDKRIELLDYHDERMMIDMTTDSIYGLMNDLNIEPPIVGYLSLLEKEIEEA